MKKIMFALGDDKPEEFIKKTLTDCEFVGSVGYREAVIPKVKEYRPDVLVLRETLQGSISVDSMIFNLRTQCEFCRIILIAGIHTPGDDFLKTVISRGVYDIVYGSQISLKKVIDFVNKPSCYYEVAELQGMEIEDNVIENKTSPDLIAVINPENSNTTDSKHSLNQTAYTVYEDYIPGTVNGAYSLPSSSYYSENKILRSDNMQLPMGYDVMPGNFKPYDGARIISFSSVRQGVGCTTVLLNTAYLLAQRGSRVLIVDAVLDCPYIFDMLSLPSLDCGMECVISNYIQGKTGTIDFYSFNNETAKRQIHSSERERLGRLTDGLSYTMFKYVPGDEVYDYFDGAIYDVARYYDYILFDVNLASAYTLIGNILRISDRVVNVNTGNGLELMINENYIRYYDPYCAYRQKMIEVINRTPKNAYYDASKIGAYYNIGNVIEIPDDFNGFVSAQDSEVFYVERGKSKIRKAYSYLLSML